MKLTKGIIHHGVFLVLLISSIQQRRKCVPENQMFQKGTTRRAKCSFTSHIYMIFHESQGETQFTSQSFHSSTLALCKAIFLLQVWKESTLHCPWLPPRGFLISASAVPHSRKRKQQDSILGSACKVGWYVCRCAWDWRSHWLIVCFIA